MRPDPGAIIFDTARSTSLPFLIPRMGNDYAPTDRTAASEWPAFSVSPDP